MLSIRVDLPPSIDLTCLLKLISTFYEVDQLHIPKRREGRRRELLHELKMLRTLSLKITLNLFGKLHHILHMENTSLWSGIQVTQNIFSITSQSYSYAATTTVLWMAAFSTGRFNTENYLDGRKILLSPPKTKPQNDGVWLEINPHKILETNNRNDVKVMIFVAITDKIIPVVHPFVNKDGNLRSVNSLWYPTLLRDTIWPVFKSTATRNW